MGQRKLSGYLSVIFLFVIPRSVNVIAVDESRGRVVDHAGGSENGLLIGNGVVNGRREHERFENGAGWPLGHRMIQLAETVVASAHQRQYLASVGIECNQSNLRDGPGKHLGLKLIFPDLYLFSA